MAQEDCDISGCCTSNPITSRQSYGGAGETRAVIIEDYSYRGPKQKEELVQF